LGGVLRAVRRVRRLLSAGDAASARFAALTAGARAFLTRDRLTLVLRFFIVVALVVERFLLALTERFLVERFLTDDEEDLAERFFTGEEVEVERFLAGEDVFAERFLLEERLLTVDVDRFLFLAGDADRLLFAERLLTILPGTAGASRALTGEDEEATGTVRAATAAAAAASVSDRFRCS
jgi:hypothetical protein